MKTRYELIFFLQYSKKIETPESFILLLLLLFVAVVVVVLLLRLQKS